jgi:hypothetical protein
MNGRDHWEAVPFDGRNIIESLRDGYRHVDKIQVRRIDLLITAINVRVS